ncbi:hypothetical protein BHE74_00025628 [Ensete ventricosum]|nr:hypothetical protein BHE74_00025628 [Ensete ventricosum]RZS03934.1 hypothetical protein BHM03_00034192 [Ensete ventricosum]
MAVLASNGYPRQHLESIFGTRRSVQDFTFSGTVSDCGSPYFGTAFPVLPATKRLPRILAKARQTESDSLVTHTSANKMVPTKDLVRKRVPSHQKPAPVNGSKMVVIGAGTSKRNITSDLVQTNKNIAPKDITFTDEVKVLPLDEGFSWANDNYNYWQRTMDIWNFVISLRIRVLFDDAKWAYIDGFTEEKQVSILGILLNHDALAYMCIFIIDRTKVLWFFLFSLCEFDPPPFITLSDATKNKSIRSNFSYFLDTL